MLVADETVSSESDEGTATASGSRGMAGGRCSSFCFSWSCECATSLACKASAVKKAAATRAAQASLLLTDFKSKNLIKSSSVLMEERSEGMAMRNRSRGTADVEPPAAAAPTPEELEFEDVVNVAVGSLEVLGKAKRLLAISILLHICDVGDRASSAKRWVPVVFVSSVREAFTNALLIDRRLSSAHRANGKVERHVGISETLLHKLLQGRPSDWHHHLSLVALPMTKWRRATSSTPFALMFSRSHNGFNHVAEDQNENVDVD